MTDLFLKSVSKFKVGFSRISFLFWMGDGAARLCTARRVAVLSHDPSNQNKTKEVITSDCKEVCRKRAPLFWRVSTSKPKCFCTLSSHRSIPWRWLRWARHCSEMDKGSSQAAKAWRTRICWESNSSRCSFNSPSFLSNSLFQKSMSPTRCLNLQAKCKWVIFNNLCSTYLWLTSVWSCLVRIFVSLSKSFVSSNSRSAANRSFSAYWLRSRFRDVHSG